VFSLLFKEGVGNQKRKISVDVPGALERVVEVTLHGFPYGVAGGPDHHAAPNRGVIGQLCRLDDVEIPLRVIGAA